MQEFQLGYLYKKWETELCSERMKNESTQTKLGILLPKDNQDAKRKAIKHLALNLSLLALNLTAIIKRLILHSDVCSKSEYLIPAAL